MEMLSFAKKHVDATHIGDVQGLRGQAQQHNGDAPEVANADSRGEQHLRSSRQSAGHTRSAIPQQSNIRQGRL